VSEQTKTPETDAAAQFISHFDWQVHADFARRHPRRGRAYRHPSTVASNTASHPCRTRRSLANAMTSP